MIIEFLLNSLLSLLSGLNISLPSVPATWTTFMDRFVELLEYGQVFIPLVFPFNAVPYIVIALSLFVFDHLKTPIKWLVDKIIEVIP